MHLEMDTLLKARGNAPSVLNSVHFCTIEGHKIKMDQLFIKLLFNFYFRLYLKFEQVFICDIDTKNK